ncbi:rRNA maturation RNase YbeY [Marinobacter orientalis]|uniref:Endoribonuclease YbeY n=1 Tax=Marinobacter orientalis TaxID=1928859 RepID=A0A7Y0WU13_9GAMM|nr:rRNA maturation RNase YbeY [Marinobacter orientalis]NMT65426.1 rRNA maturation RNase YbeY [Marinobacter orientalis]TGX47333.1 rRNA maturation RNase YbeY [Marinobacter orientalis]
MSELTVDLQRAFDLPGVPEDADFEHWAQAAWLGEDPSEVTIRIVASDESAELNSQYRGKSGPTNVLSFPFEAPAGITVPLAGDLVICAPVVEKEAAEQQKTLTEHWAHMVVHGMLHLQGYDHIDDGDAEVMEALEIRLLGQLGFNNPYETEETEKDS